MSLAPHIYFKQLFPVKVLWRRVLLWMVLFAALVPALRAQTTNISGLTATFNSAEDVPRTESAVAVSGVLNITLNFAPTPGTNLTVIRSTGRSLISGAFTNAANGSARTLSFGGVSYAFTVWYYGGENNNDLMLLWRNNLIVSWGNNGSGQLGDNSTTQRLAPVEVVRTGVLAGKSIVQIARGTNHSLALCSDGTLAAWGSNASGQLGTGTTTSSQVPMAVQQTGTSALTSKKVIAVAAGGTHSLALCSDGTVAAWGSNTSGQLGNGLTTNSSTPVLVSNAIGGALNGKLVTSVAAGNDHNLALCADGTLVSWGQNTYGQLGDGTTTRSSLPKLVDLTTALSGQSVRSIAAGESFSLALTFDNVATSWGYNSAGQLGDGSTTTRSLPVLVNTTNGALMGKTITRLTAGTGHSLALCSDNTIASWGRNTNGQLGNNSTSSSTVPVQVNSTSASSALVGKNIRVLEGGLSSSYALCSDGSVACWGLNAAGELGDNSTASAYLAQLANNGYNTSALADRTPVGLSAGANSSHGLALCARRPLTVITESPSDVTSGSAIFNGQVLGETDAITTDTGFVWATVPNPTLTDHWEILGPKFGNFSITAAGLPAASTIYLRTFMKVGTVTSYGNTIRFATPAADGSLSWNYQARDEVPTFSSACNGTLTLTLEYVPTPGQNLMVVSNPSRNFLNGRFSNVANGAVVDLSYNGQTYSYVAWYYGGDGNDLVLLWKTTHLASWGENFYGQLGNGTKLDSSLPAPADQSGVLAGKTIAQVTRSSNHCIALCTDGTVAVWGNNFYGQLGDESTSDRVVPVLVNRDEGSALFGKNVVSVSAGYYHSLALCDDGTVVAWGNNSAGRLGDNTTTNSSLPVAVNNTDSSSALFGRSVVSVAAGRDHSMALCSDGTVVGWGSNGSGRLGDGTTTNRLLPVAVTTSSGALAGKTVIGIGVGGNHSFARCSDGTLAAWGSNTYGQLGDKTTNSSSTPVAVDRTSTSALLGKTITAVVGGTEHSLALCSDGSVAAWGDNSNGQLGDRTTVNRLSPVAVFGFSDPNLPMAQRAVRISCGSLDSRAVLADGSIAGWGDNVAGQVGDGSTSDKSFPVRASFDPASALFDAFVSTISVGVSGQQNEAIYASERVRAEVVTATANSIGIQTAELGGSIISIGSAPVIDRGIVWSTATRPTLNDNKISAADGAIPGAFQVSVSGLPSNTLLYARAFAITDQVSYGNEISFTTLPAPVGDLSWAYQSPTDVPMTAVAVDLTGGNLQLSLNFAPTAGTSLTVIRKTSRGFISGQFGNVANGATVVLNYLGTDYPFVAWYYGGDGNDLVLLWPRTGLAAWGYNASGQLGNATTNQRLEPTAVELPEALEGKTFVQVACGTSHSLALATDGLVYAWGSNSSGQLGDGTTTNRWVPGSVMTTGTSALAGKTVVSLSVGSSSTTVLCSDGTLVDWGNGTTIPTTLAASGALLGRQVVAIASGSSHRLALCLDGSLVAWGSNTYGQLGLNDTDTRQSKTSVLRTGGSALAGKSVTAIAAGSNHSLALCSDGSLVAWGANDRGQVGDGTILPGLIPTAVNQQAGTSALNGRTIGSLAAGGSHSLVSCTDGTVVAWGDNARGQLGDNTTLQRNFPTLVDTTNGISALNGKFVGAVCAGSTHSQALCTDGTLASWGYNNRGQVGDNTTTQRNAPAQTNAPTATHLLVGRTIKALSQSGLGEHSLAIYTLSAPPVLHTLPAEDVTPSTAVIKAQLADEGTAAILEQGIVWDTTPAPAQYSFKGITSPGTGAFSFPLGNLTSNTTYYFRSYVRTVEGLTYGNEMSFTTPTNSIGNLTGSYDAAVDIPLTADAVDLTGGTLDLTLNFAPSPGTNLTVINNTNQGFITGQFSNAVPGSTINLTFNGKQYPFVVWYYGGDGNDLVLLWPFTKLAGWGDNQYGQLGDNSTTNRSAPTVPDFTKVVELKTIVQVSHGSGHSLALCSDGTILSWGFNNSGQLGNRSTTSSKIPQIVNSQAGLSALSGKTVVAVAAGGNRSLALCSDGTVAAWGEGSSGQLGANGSSDRTLPVSVNTTLGLSALAGKFVVRISAGLNHSLALCSDGTVVGWGSGSSGQLGNGSTASTSVPVAVNRGLASTLLTGKSVLAISCGSDHSLALCADGTVAAWGENGSGQLGNNSTTDALIPISVNTDSSSALTGKTVQEIKAGGNHSLVLCTDGTLAAWGSNNDGQIGDGTRTNRNVPTLVNTSGTFLSGKSITSLLTGATHSLALCSDGTIATWGSNTYGQLGDASTTYRPLPVAVNRTPGTSALAGKIPTMISSGSLGNHTLSVFGMGAPPTVSTLPAINVTLAAAEISGSVTSEGDAPVTERGMLWSPTPDPNFYSQKIALGSGLGNMSTALTGLMSNFTYYYRAYAINTEGIAYGSVQTFTTGYSPIGDLSWTFTSASEVPYSVSAVVLLGGTLDLGLNFAPTPGTSLTVLRNTGPAFIQGQFSNAPNGTIVNLSYQGINYAFVVWYYGGNGNDLVLLWPHTGLAAWGYNYYGQLGDNTNVTRTIPTAVIQTGDLLGKTIVQVASGADHSLALCSDGTVAAWGSNGNGELGDNTTTRRSIPTKADLSGLNGRKVIAVAAGDSFSLALCSDGSVAAWGENYNWQLGDGTATSRRIPTLVNATSSALAGRRAVAVSAGGVHSLALCSDGTVVGWGYNSSGQLGNGTDTNMNLATLVSTSPGVSALAGKTVLTMAAGNSHNLALCSDGTLCSWGYDGSGALGDNSTEVSSPIPVAVSTDSSSGLFGKSVGSIAAGRGHNLVLCVDGSLVAWGSNYSGNLDPTTFSTKPLPILINPLPWAGKQITAVSAGYDASYTLDSAGTLLAWGRNSYGELGDGSTTTRSSPVAVNAAPGSALAGRFVSSISASTTTTSGSHVLAVYVLRAPEAWRQANFGLLTNSGLAANDADPDGDGMSNLVEFAFGLNPLKPNSSADLPQFLPQGNQLVANFAPPAGASGVIYSAEWSDSLLSGNWQPITDTDNGPGCSFSLPMGPQAKKFVRLRVSQP